MSGNRPRSRRKRSSEQDFRTDLVSIWRRHEDGGSAPSRGGYLALARGLLAQGEPLLAYDVIAAAVAIWPSEIRFKQLQALALARSGAIGRANVLLEQLRRSGAKDEETLGLLGRTYKDLALEAVGSRRKELLQRAAAIYEQAYKTTGGYWSGINAATMNLLIGEQERACRIATKVRRQCSKQVKDPRGDQYWELAALGEAALICREWTEAKDWYARAGQERKHRFGDLQSSRRNASLILDYWRKDESEIEKYLNIPPVIVFAGHMIDRPEREPPRFPPNLEREVAAMLDRTLTKLRPGFGFASAACGSDILFIEAMLRLGAEVAIVLPYEKAEFVSDSVDFVPQSNWRARFERVLKRAWSLPRINA